MYGSSNRLNTFSSIYFSFFHEFLTHFLKCFILKYTSTTTVHAKLYTWLRISLTENAANVCYLLYLTPRFMPSILHHFQLHSCLHPHLILYILLSSKYFSCGFAMGCIEGRVAVEFFSEMQNKVVQQKSKLSVVWCENKYRESAIHIWLLSFIHSILFISLSSSLRSTKLLLSHHIWLSY